MEGGGEGQVKEGHMAVIHTEMDTYSRVKVTNVNVEADQVCVTFLDHGNTSQLPLSSLVCLSGQQLAVTRPPLAHHSTLAIVCSCQDCGQGMQGHRGWEEGIRQPVPLVSDHYQRVGPSKSNQPTRLP